MLAKPRFASLWDGLTHLDGATCLFKTLSINKNMNIFYN